MDWLIALVALTAMEIVLGIDNIVFIAVLSSKLPLEQQAWARRLGLLLALVTRVLLLLTLTWILGLTEPIFSLPELGFPKGWLQGEHTNEMAEVSTKDIILLVGGLFLIWKSVSEIHEKVEGHEKARTTQKSVSFVSVLIQIALLDIIFSLDSVITAVGMAKEIWVMVTAVILAVGVMLVFAEYVSAFVERHPTVKMLALSFLILIGVMLVAESIGTPINKGYIYFAMAFSLVVEILNIRIRVRPALPADSSLATSAPR